MEVFYKQGVLKNSTNSQENICVGETDLKKNLRHRCFPVNIAKFLRTHFFTEYSWTTAFVFVYFQGFIIFYL